MYSCVDFVGCNCEPMRLAGKHRLMDSWHGGKGGFVSNNSCTEYRSCYKNGTKGKGCSSVCITEHDPMPTPSRIHFSSRAYTHTRYWCLKENWKKVRLGFSLGCICLEGNPWMLCFKGFYKISRICLCEILGTSHSSVLKFRGILIEVMGLWIICKRIAYWRGVNKW